MERIHSSETRVFRAFALGLVVFFVLSAEGFGYYQAEKGRWLSRDPIGEPGGNNLYSFVGNEPISRRDVLGLEWEVYRNQSARASVRTCSAHDTIDSLGKRLGLSEGGWLRDSAGGRVASIKNGKWYTVPNTVIIAIGDMSGMLWKEGYLGAYQLAGGTAHGIRRVLNSKGYRALFYDWQASPFSKSAITSVADQDLYGISFFGHGTINVSLWPASFSGGEFNIHGNDDLYPGDVMQRHRFGLVDVVLCNAASSSWDSLASANGVQYIQPFFMTWPWQFPGILWSAFATATKVPD